MRSWHRWAPAGCFGFGCLLLLSVQRQVAMPLRGDLDSLPRQMAGYTGYNQVISQEEQDVAGMSHYSLRTFVDADTVPAFSVYVGYYEQQTQGRTIHSPRNCLPGAGWEALSSSRVPVVTGSDTSLVNRYELANKDVRALVYYWYQGRGRVASSEYAVKWDLLRDAALTGRTEEALVRIVIPMGDDRIAQPDSLAQQVARIMIPEVAAILPAGK